MGSNHAFDDEVDGLTYCSRCGHWRGAAPPVCTPRRPLPPSAGDDLQRRGRLASITARLQRQSFGNLRLDAVALTRLERFADDPDDVDDFTLALFVVALTNAAEDQQRAGLRERAREEMVGRRRFGEQTHADRDYRRRRLRESGCRPYPMPFVRTDDLRGFARWVVGAYDKRIPWDRWQAARYSPRRLGDRRVSLPLFGGS